MTALLDSPQISAMFDKVRTAVAPPPPDSATTNPPGTEPTAAPSPIGRGSRLARLGIAAVILITWWLYAPSRSPWMRLTLPGGTRSANVVASETSLYNGDFFHNDNLVALKQLDLVKGNRETFARKVTADDPQIGYAVIGNLFTVGLSSPYALWAFNLVLYAWGAWLVMRLTETLFNDRTKAQLAAALFVLSIAATVHVGDLSPHLLAIVLSYLWTLILLRLEIEERPYTGCTLLGLSALLGAWSLVSMTSIFGLAALAFVLFKRRNFLAILFPVLAWYALPQLEHALFAHFGLAPTVGSESAGAWQALRVHGSHLAADPLGYGCFLIVELGNFVLNDNPLVVLCGVLGLITLRHRAKWLLWVCFLVPTAVTLVLLPATAARGAAVAGNTIVLFAVASHFAVETSRKLGRRLGATSAVMPLVVLVAAQALWSHSILFGWLYPAGAYATGAFENAGLMWPADFVRMTGPLEEMPTVAGGSVSACVSYGLVDGFGRQVVLPANRLAPYADRWSGLPAVLRSLALQAPVLGCILAAALALLRLRWGLLTTILMAGAVTAASLCGAAVGMDPHVLRAFNDRIALKEDEKLVAHIHLSHEFREMLERAARENQQVEFAVRLRGVNAAVAKPAEIQVDEWASDESRFTVDAPLFLEALRAHDGRVELAISPKAGSHGVLLHSWQALGNSESPIAVGPSAGGREATIVRTDGTIEPLEWFPSFEIRVVRGKNAYPFKAVIEPFEQSRPAGYVLIGL